MLADFLTMHESSHRPDDAITYTYIGDAHSNVGRSLLVMGAIMGSDVRICAPQELWPPPDVRDLAGERAEGSGASILLTDDRDRALHGTDFVYTDVWVSMGEAKEKWDDRVRLLAPYQVNPDALKRTANPGVTFLHCLHGRFIDCIRGSFDELIRIPGPGAEAPFRPRADWVERQGSCESGQVIAPVHVGPVVAVSPIRLAAGR